jgi:dynein heavy chain, axonemal
MYLEPIFSSPDISAQLPIEAKRFATVDRAWRKAADAAKRAPGLLTAAANPRLLDSLLESARLLDSVQKGLAAYLEMKRAGFARLFFLSNDELLAVLSQVQCFFSIQDQCSPPAPPLTCTTCCVLCFATVL